MSADFWASYVSGAIGIIIGNPLDVIKVRLQAAPPPTTSSSASTVSQTTQLSGAGRLVRGTAAPILGYGALNSILFMTYNRTSNLLKTSGAEVPPDLWTTFVAGAIGGLATWVVSTPTELIKCRAQLSTSGATSNSWGITKDIIRAEGIRGLYFGGVVTALRDSIGYGFYFYSYELSSRFMVSYMKNRGMDSTAEETAKVLICGGLAGVATWASVFPLDVIKTRVQTQIMGVENAPLLGAALGEGIEQRKLGAIEISRNAYKTEGPGVFFRGLGVCSVRAFIVNAAQWAVYEWLMRELGSKKGRTASSDVP
jgi:solute carrier family 25 carnitine/acylcarnitine transporter 20/29